MSQDKKPDIYDTGERAELKGYEILQKFLILQVRGIFVFKTRKGEILAAAATFFGFLSFCPLLLLIIGLYGKLTGDSGQSFEHVISLMKEHIPTLSPEILNQLRLILKKQMSAETNQWFNLGVIFYSSLGFVGSLNYGMHTLAYLPSRGGWFFETLKSILGGLFIGSFTLMLLLTSTKSSFIWSLLGDNFIASSLKWLADYQIIQAIIYLACFSVYYKYITNLKIRWFDGFLGAFSAVIVFHLLKTFYWVYLHYVQDKLRLSFGGFYNYIVIILFIYFTLCTFLFGAAVSYAPTYRRKGHPSETDGMPPLPDSSDIGQ